MVCNIRKYQISKVLKKDVSVLETQVVETSNDLRGPGCCHGPCTNHDGF